MSDPTILDYVKEKLTFWKKGTLHIPTLEEARASDGWMLKPTEMMAEPEPAEPNRVILELQEIKLPWRALIGIVLAIFAQVLVERGEFKTPVVLGLYGLSLAFCVWAYLKDEWVLQDIPEDVAEEGRFKINYFYLIAAAPAGLLTFLVFQTGKFSLPGLIVWAVAIAAIVGSFVNIKPPLRDWAQKIIHWLKDWPKSIQFKPVSLVVLVLVAVVIFFRVYRLNEVPLEMTSDHVEKLMDVQDVLNGDSWVYFIRNTGREAIQFYLTAWISKAFSTGISFMSLKIGTVLLGLLTLPFIYLSGKELASKRVGVLAMFLAGVAFWPNVISRVGLRFPLYPLFVAPTFYFLLKGLRTKSRRDVVLAGVFLGIGMHGYTPFRIVPVMVVAAALIYILHAGTSRNRLFALNTVAVVALVSFVIFLPLFRFSVDNQDIFYYRMLTRASSLEAPLPGNPVVLFFGNLKNAMLMFGYTAGATWLHSIPNRPAMDQISAALIYIGMVLILVRYLRKHKWQDLFLIVSIPILMLPSILSLAFPVENPNLPRTGGAIVPVFIIIALLIDGLAASLERGISGVYRKPVSYGFLGLILLVITNTNYNLMFDKYDTQFRMSAGNTTEMGAIIKDFATSIGTPDTVWIVGYPYWVDTRLPSIVAGYPIRDYAIWPDQFEETLNYTTTKLFIFNPTDTADMDKLKEMYPDGRFIPYTSAIPDKDLTLFLVPAVE